MISALLLLVSSGAPSAADEAMKELPSFLKSQTALEESFPVAEKCRVAFEAAKDPNKLESFGEALVALETREGMSNLAARAMSRDCVIWYLGRKTGEIDATAAQALRK